jgi:hypothetical protein
LRNYSTIFYYNQAIPTSLHYYNGGKRSSFGGLRIIVSLQTEIRRRMFIVILAVAGVSSDDFVKAPPSAVLRYANFSAVAACMRKRL